MMLNPPIVSIIIPCYNSGRFIEETLNSVYLQTFSSWECIVINDGSIDNSEEIILKKIGYDERFKYIYQENTGVCLARNIAINASSGKYVLCLDGDDLISENFIEETVKLIETDSNIKIVTTTVQYFGRNNGKMKVLSYSMPVMLASNQIVITSLFRKSDFDKVQGFKENMRDGFEDWDFWISILKRGGSVKYTSKAVFYYRILRKSRNSVFANTNLTKLRLQIWENHRELYSKYFVAPTSYCEYQAIIQSKEYRLGKLLLTPIRKIWNLLK